MNGVCSSAVESKVAIEEVGGRGEGGRLLNHRKKLQEG